MTSDYIVFDAILTRQPNANIYVDGQRNIYRLEGQNVDAGRLSAIEGRMNGLDNTINLGLSQLGGVNAQLGAARCKPDGRVSGRR